MQPKKAQYLDLRPIFRTCMSPTAQYAAQLILTRLFQIPRYFEIRNYFPWIFPSFSYCQLFRTIFSFPWEFQIAVVQLHVIYRAWGLYEGNTGPCLEHGVDNTQERNFFSWYGLEQVNDWMIEKRFVETIPCPILRKYWTDWKTFWLAELSY